MRAAGRFGILLGLIIAISCTFSVVLAQSINQTQLRGTVTDSSGAIVAGAKVTITDIGTNISQTTTSNATGTYAFTALRASDYKLLVEAPAFGANRKRRHHPHRQSSNNARRCIESCQSANQRANRRREFLYC